MKHLYALGALLLSCMALPAQDLQPYQAPANKDQAVKKSLTRSTGMETVENIPVQKNFDSKTTTGTQKSATYWETIIGLTIYDLQSNGSVQNRLAQTGVELSAAFTMSQQSSSYTDRGTGYNFGYSDVNEWYDEDYERLESERVGWPSIIQTGDGKEIVITHRGEGGLNMVSRDVAGVGDWSESEVPTETGHWMLWPRAVAGGEDGNTIHLICITAPEANGGEMYQGFDGALLYSRSLDQGATWDIMDSILAPIDTTIWKAFDGDSYNIHANGNNISFGVFHDFADSFVMESSDNGDTWDFTRLVDFPVDGYVLDSFIIDLDEDELADTLYNTDGSGSVLVDDNGVTHITYGNMRYLDETLDDDQFSYFPYTDGLQYWNSTYGTDSAQTIAVTMDMDGDDIVTLEDEIGLYYVSLTGMPSMGVHDNGDLFLSYSGIVETHSSGSQYYRHVFLMTSDDNGLTWTTPVDITPDEDYFGFESVFASMAPRVDDYVHLIYQRDYEPGMHVRGDEDFPATDNDIVYHRITTDLVVEEWVSVEETEALDKMEMFPIPADDVLNVYVPDHIVDRIDILDVTGKLISNVNPRSENTVLNTSNLAPGMYLIQLTLNGSSTSRPFIKK